MRLEPELGNTAWMIYSAKEDYAGLGTWYAWTNSTYLNRRCIGRFKRGPGGPRSAHQGLVKRMGHTWEEAEVAALNRPEWRRIVAQCNFDAVWIKSSQDWQSTVCRRLLTRTLCSRPRPRTNISAEIWFISRTISLYNSSFKNWQNLCSKRVPYGQKRLDDDATGW